jgi:N,N'-diacetyllegionaminate synthase
MKIGNYDTRTAPLIIAEAGNNHEGDFDVARRLVEEAAAARAHGVKFQTFRTEHYVSSSDRARFERLKSFELRLEQFEELSRLAHRLGLLFISTPFDLESARGLSRFVDAFKIASGDVDFYPLIEQVLAYGKPVIVSTGASSMEKVSATVDLARARLGARMDDDFALLHCVSSYPAPAAEVNLLSIPHMRETFGVSVGFSDHTSGPEASTFAIAVGAEIIEKHFTLDKNQSSFRDHQLSADPAEFRRLVQAIAAMRAMLGARGKSVQASEAGSELAIRRSIVAARAMAAGERISISDLTWIRPRNGLAPGAEPALVNRRLRRAVEFGQPILREDCE